MTLRESNYILSPHTFLVAEACPAARVYKAQREKPNAAQWHGIAIHRFLEYAMRDGREVGLGYIRRKFKRLESLCASIPLDQIPEGVVEPQYLIDTGRQQAILLEHARDLKAEGDPKVHVQVRADVVAHGEAKVADFKTGKTQIDPKTSVQSLIEVLAVWLDRGRPPTAEATIFNIFSEKKVVQVVPKRYVFTTAELEAGLRRVRRVHLQVIETRAEYHYEDTPPAFSPGPHCVRCDALGACDAGQAR